MDEVLAPSLETNPKQFWSFIRSQRKESTSIPTLISDGESRTSDKTKAEALNKQFSSVFTDENVASIPSKGSSTFSDIADLDIELESVIKQLTQINVNKAGGPDEIPARMLHDYAVLIAPMLHFICQQSHSTDTLPADWRRAYVTGIYKKGIKSLPENYRPVSLTCISCKLMEHIVLSHVSKQLAAYNIIVENQHGFHEKRSCETQLLEAVHNWTERLNRSGQTGILLLDFSKTFDKVLHQRLAEKLHHYGIRGMTLK